MEGSIGILGRVVAKVGRPTTALDCGCGEAIRFSEVRWMPHFTVHTFNTL